MTKDEVVKILNDNSQKSVIGWAIEEDDFNEVAEKIVKLCNLQNVSNRRELFDKFYAWLDGLTQEEYDDISLTDKCETFFFKLDK